MKRVLVLFLILGCLICGCKNKREVKLRTDFLIFTLNARYNGEKYSLDVETKSGGSMECTVKSPETLSGMKCLISNDKISINYRGLEIDKKFSDIPFGSAVSLLYSAIEDGNNKSLTLKNGDYSLCGQVDGVDYEFTATEEGLPVSLNLNDEKIFLDFTNLILVNSSK